MILIIAFSLFLFISVLTNEQEETYQHRWIDCITFLKEGKLYEGQPRCIQGPVIFIMGLIIQQIFGQSALQIVSKVLFLLLSLSIFLLMQSIIKNETQKKGIRPPPSLISFLIFITFFFYYSRGHLEIVFATFFLLSGFFCLFYMDFKAKEVVAGILFSFALLSKMTAIYMIIFFLLLYFWDFLKMKQWSRIKNFVFPFFLLFNTLFLPTLLFVLKERSFAYLITVPRILMTFRYSFQEALITFFSLRHLQDNPHSLIVLLFIVALYGFIRYKERIFLFILPVFLTYITIIGVLGSTEVGSYFLSAKIFLLIGFLVILAHELSASKVSITKYATFAFLLIVLLMKTIPLLTLPPSALLDADSKKIEMQFRELVEAPLKFIPPQQGKVLTGQATDIKNLKVSEPYFFVNESVLQGRDEFPEIGITFPFLYDIDADWLKHQELINAVGGSTEEIKRLYDLDFFYANESLKKIEQRLSLREYSLVILAHPKPKEWVKIINILTNRDSVNNYYYYYYLYAPNYFFTQQNADHTLILLFKNPQDKKVMTDIFDKYYTEKFDEICSWSQTFTEEIVDYLKLMDNVIIQKKCTSGADRIAIVTNTSLNYYRELFALSIILIFIFFNFHKKLPHRFS